MYVYRKTEWQLWTVGYYSPDGRWHSESDHNSRAAASARVSYLNGGKDDPWFGAGEERTDAD